MTLSRIKKGDTVVVLAGKERGKRGVVREVLPKDNRAIVQDLNISKRHRKPGQGARQAGIIDVEQPIHLSNLAPVDVKQDRATRVRTSTLSGGKKVRIATVSGEQLGRD
jgi:large subunit ribosomal protein L24